MLELSSGAADGKRPVLNDCWNKIGIRGDSSCPELKKHVHCRNCLVHSAAALALLDREIPPEYLADWTVHFAEKKEVEDGESHSAIIFRIGPEWFALPTLVLDEVAEQRRIHSLPHRRGGTVLGLVNVRGELIICVSLGKMMGLGETASPPSAEAGTARGRLVIISHEGGRMAFPVDEVQSTLRYHPRDLSAVPSTIAKGAAPYTKAVLAWQGRIVGYLDDQLLVQTLTRNVA